MRGFTLIELLIVLAIIGIFLAVITGAMTDGTLCRGGYKFVQTRWDVIEYRQLMDAQGRGIPCEER